MSDVPQFRFHRSGKPICPYCDHVSTIAAPGLEAFILHCDNCDRSYDCKVKIEDDRRIFITAPSTLPEEEETKPQQTLPSESKSPIEPDGFYQAFEDSLTSAQKDETTFHQNTGKRENPFKQQKKTPESDRQPDIVKNRNEDKKKKRKEQAENTQPYDVVLQMPFWAAILLIICAIAIVTLAAVSFTRVQQMAGTQKQDTERFEKHLVNRVNRPDKTPAQLLQEARQSLHVGDENRAITLLTIISNTASQEKISTGVLYGALLLSHETLKQSELSQSIANRVLAQGKEKEPNALHQALAIEVMTHTLDDLDIRLAWLYQRLPEFKNYEKEKLIGSIANSYLSLNRFQDMQAMMEQIHQAHPSSPSALRNLAVATHLQNIHTKEQADTSAPPEKSPPEVTSAAPSKKSDTPEKIFKKAITLAPTDAGLWFDLTVYYLQVEKKDEAAISIEQAIRLSPANEKYHLLSADIYQSMGRREKAIWRLSIAAALKKNNQEREQTQGKAGAF